MLCPHTACGVAAAEDYLTRNSAGPTLPVVCLATAHPAKFNDAVRDAIGQEPVYPPALETIQAVCPNMSSQLHARVIHSLYIKSFSFLRDVCTPRTIWTPSRTS